eukprot:403349768
MKLSSPRYKTKLTEKAVQICKDLHINPDDMIDKSLDFFLKSGKDLREVAELRYNHYQNKRIKYFEQIIKIIGPLTKKKQRSPYLNNSMININQLQDNQSLLPQIQPNSNNNANKLQVYNLQQSLTNTNSPTRQRRDAAASNLIQLSPLMPQQTNQETKKPVTVGKVSFRPANLSQDQRLLVNQSNASGDGFITQQNRSQSPQIRGSIGLGFPGTTRFNNKNYQVQLAQKLVEKEQERVNKLRKVRINAVMLAEQEIQKYEEKIQTKHQKFGMFQESMKRKQSEDQRRVLAQEQKRNQARNFFSQTQKQLETKSQTIYDSRLQEISQLSLQKSQREQKMSSSQYLKLKQKLQEEMHYSSKQSQLKRIEEHETSQFLDRLESKVDRGQQKAQKYLQDNLANFTNKFETSLHETYKNYRGLVEQQFNTSVDRVKMKDMMIETKLRKKQEEESKRRNQIRNLISSKFDRNKSIRDNMLHQQESKIKATLDRIDQKFKVHETLSGQREIENMKRKEINTLRMLDVRENFMKSKEYLLLDKARVMNKMQRIDDTRRQADEIKKSVIDKLKFSNLLAERDVLTNIKPKEVLIRAKLNLTLQATEGSPRNRSKRRNYFHSQVPGFKSTTARANKSMHEQE